MTGADDQEWKSIVQEVCALHGISVQHLLSPRRGAALVSARQECAKRLRATGLSLQRIGAIMNRDHSSIIYLLRDRKPSGMQKATVEAAVADLCRKHAISIEELRSGRHAAINEIRRECAEMLRSTGMTLDQIGRVLDRDHTTVRQMLSLRRARSGHGRNEKDEERGPTARPKIFIGFRLTADVVEGIKATGKGYSARVERVLRDALAQGKL